MLNDLKPEKMFMFIMKATMLEEIRSWYQVHFLFERDCKRNFK